MCIAIHKAMGGKSVIVVDIDPKKREAAKAAGADMVFDGGTPDAAAQIVAATNGGAWAVIDLVGSSATARLGIDSLIKGGKYIIVGLYGGDITLSLPPFPMRAITIQGSYVGSLPEMRELIELVQRTGLPPVPVATRPLDDVNAVMSDLRAGKIVGRVVLTPRLAVIPGRREAREPGIHDYMAEDHRIPALASLGRNDKREDTEKQMDATELRAMQAPIKDRYKSDPGAALITLKAKGSLDDQNIACKVETGRALAVAGLHPATGGSGMELCSGDMLLEALVACAGVTLKAVSTALAIPLKSGTVSAEGDLDFRGTLGVDKEAPVGFRQIRLRFDVETDAPQDKLDQLLKLTERYCVVYQTIAKGPPVDIKMQRV